jgi:hypothetical protein
VNTTSLLSPRWRLLRLGMPHPVAYSGATNAWGRCVWASTSAGRLATFTGNLARSFMNAEAGDHFHKMRCNWQRWLWGLIPLLLLAWAAITVERGRIEQDLTERANRALAESGSKWASVALHGRDIQLTGRALQDDEPPKAEETLRKIWGRLSPLCGRRGAGGIASGSWGMCPTA